MGTAKAEVELSAGLSGIGARLGTALDILTARQSRHEQTMRQIARRIEARPVVIDLLQAGPLGSVTSQPVVPTPTAVLVLDLGSPQQGTRWTVRSLRCSDAAAVTASVAGRGDWFVGTPSVTAGGLPLPICWRWSMPTLPNVTTVPEDAITVTANDNLLFALSGGTAGQQICVTATAVVYELAARATSVQEV